MELLLGEMTMVKSQGRENLGGVRSPGNDDYNRRTSPGKEQASKAMLLPDRHGFKTRLRDPAARCARGFPSISLPSPIEGAGNAGRPMRPIAACAMLS